MHGSAPLSGGRLPARGGSVRLHEAGVIFNSWFPGERAVLVSDRSRFRTEPPDRGSFSIPDPRGTADHWRPTDLGSTPNRSWLSNSLFPPAAEPELKTTPVPGMSHRTAHGCRTAFSPSRGTGIENAPCPAVSHRTDHGYRTAFSPSRGTQGRSRRCPGQTGGTRRLLHEHRVRSSVRGSSSRDGDEEAEPSASSPPMRSRPSAVGAIVRRRGGAGPMHPRRRTAALRPISRVPRDPGESVGARGGAHGRMPARTRAAVDAGPPGARAGRLTAGMARRPCAASARGCVGPAPPLAPRASLGGIQPCTMTVRRVRPARAAHSFSGVLPREPRAEQPELSLRAPSARACVPGPPARRSRPAPGVRPPPSASPECRPR
jgi:hypothetical protein